MKFTKIAASDAPTADLVSRILPYSPILRNHVEFFKKPGDAATSRKEQDDLSVNTRALDSAYTPIVTKPAYATAGRKILGATVRLDVARERMGYDLASEMQAQLRREAPGVAFGFNKLFINGDASSNSQEFNGLKVLCAGDQILKSNTNGHQLAMGNSDTVAKAKQLFLEKLDETIAQCRGINKVIVTNGAIIARLNTYAREYIDYTKDTFGQRIARYNGIPLVDIEEGGNDVMPFDETQGTATNKCSSIYVVSLEEEAGLSFLTTNEGFKVYPVQKVSNWYESQIELIADSILLRDKAISRLSGLYL